MCRAPSGSKLGFPMSLIFSPLRSPHFSVQSRQRLAIPGPSISKTLVSLAPRNQIPQISISSSSKLAIPSLGRPQFCSSSSSSTSTEPESSPSIIVFIKGLPKSTSEGSLEKAFSKFGGVSRVKIITDRKSKQSLGFAYVWFTSKESAEMSVKEMNGEFFDGRFILVTFARPGSCKVRADAKPLKL